MIQECVLVEKMELVVGVVPSVEMPRVQGCAPVDRLSRNSLSRGSETVVKPVQQSAVEPNVQIGGSSGSRDVPTSQQLPGAANFEWKPVTEAMGASQPYFVLILGEGWGFLGALEALDSRHEEWVLRPIILWSKSFSGAQLNWKSWEKELYAIKEFLWIWATLVSGMFGIVRTR